MTDSNVRSRRFTNAVVELPSWKKKLLSLSLAGALIGGGAKAASMFMMREQATTSMTTTAPMAQSDGAMPQNSSGFMGSRSATSDDGSTTTTTTEQTVSSPSFTERTSGWVMKIGLSIFVGVIIGTIFRMFIKTMAVLAALVVAAIAVMSYFNVLNIDFTVMKTNYESAAHWAKDQGWRLKELVMGALPSTTMAAIGFFLGFKK